MKKLALTSTVYMVLGLLLGVFYREFTKFNNFTGETQLSVAHTHALALGMIFFLIILALEPNFKLSQTKPYNSFFNIYNAGLIGVLIMMTLKGSLQVRGIETGHAIAGISGLSHILLTIGLIQFTRSLFASIKKIEN